jgi:hypothetical protein
VYGILKAFLEILLLGISIRSELHKVSPSVPNVYTALLMKAWFELAMTQMPTTGVRCKLQYTNTLGEYGVI